MPVMRRRPLLRAAAIRGGAFDASRRRAAARLRATGAPSPFEQLRELGRLHAQGVLTDEEFAVQKAKILRTSAMGAGTER